MKTTRVKLIACSLMFAVLFSCAGQNSFKEFSFLDSSGDKYSLSTLNKDYQKHYNLDINPNVVLLLTDSINNDNYIKQMENLYKIKNVEERSIIFITATRDQKDISGYHTDIKTTLELFKGKADNFYVTLISNKGQKILESKEPLSSTTIEKIFPYKKNITIQ